MTTDLLDRPLPLLPEVVDDATRRQFLAGLVAVGVLAACGDDSAAGPENDEATRTVTHALGDAEVPERPERVVALGGIYVAALLHLGVVPVAVGDDDARQIGVYRDRVPRIEDISVVPTVGDPYEPSLESIAARRPDLIVGDEFLGELYDDLSGAAPTVLVTYINNGGWRERFRAVAEAVGRADRVEGIDAEYQAAIDALPADLARSTVAFVRADADGSFRIDSLPTAFPGSVADDAGIPTLQPDGVGELEEGSGFLQLSGEQLGVLAEADVIVLGDASFYDPELTDSRSVLEANPLWDTLPAVTADQVLQIPGPIYNGGNYYAAMLLLDALAGFV